ncbi:MAG: cyclic nucleotide-binding domain-containing protein [Nitrospirae bacterium]|nr:cyclic nucleotide-binding domain-containing protein [Nitrospirota bacterium]
MARSITGEDEKKIAIMRSVSFFSTLSDEELIVILDNSKWLKCSPGDIVVREGDTEHSFFIILKGSVSIQKRMGGASMKKPISKLKIGQCFGEMSVITGQPRTADAVAAEETFVLKVDADTLNKDTESFEYRSMQFKFYKIFAEILARRLAMTNMLVVKPA